MPSARTQIANQGLAFIGVSQQIVDLDLPSERSNEAIQCRLFFDSAVEFALRDADWNSARRYVALALEASAVLTGLSWTYKYVYPADCAALRAILPPGLRQPRADQRVDYEVANENIGGGDKLVIYTDQPQAVARYTKFLTNPNLFDSQLALAISYLLGSMVAMPLAVKPAIAEQARNGYAAMISRAGAANLRERQDGVEPESQLIAYRNG